MTQIAPAVPAAVSTGNDATTVMPYREPAYSIVIPFFNEAKNAPALLIEVSEVMQRLARPYELILVDDGSTDDTHGMLVAHLDGCARKRVVQLASNHGQAFALFTGIQVARAPIVITLDGDGQNDPADIPLMLAGLADADMVVGVRVARCDSLLRRALSLTANSIRRRLLRDGVDDSGCALKAFKRTVIPAILPLQTLYSFLPAMAVTGGFVVIQRPVSHRARSAGTSSYGLRRFLWRPLVDTVGLWWFSRRSFPWRKALDEVAGGLSDCPKTNE